MKIEIGESLLYSWLKHIQKCQVVQTNWKSSILWFEGKREEELNIDKKHFDVVLNIAHGLKEKFNIQININDNIEKILGFTEIDNLGISFLENTKKIIAVESAFHEGGLNYGSNGDSKVKVIEKFLRTAICLLTVFPNIESKIIFATPKASSTLVKDIEEITNYLHKEFKDNGLSITFEIISNEKYYSEILDKVLKTSDKIADSNELFVRSNKLIQMFASNIKDNSKDFGLDEYKIGVIAKLVIPKYLEENEISNSELEEYLDQSKSKELFGLNYPLLVKADSDFDTRRYYTS